MKDTKLDFIINKLDKHEDMISTLIKMVGTLSATTEELKEDVHVLKEDMHQLKGTTVPKIQSDITLLRENQTVLYIQQEQQKILERLSFRSISHEADIAELRRIK